MSFTANCNEADQFSRLYVHGLNTSYLEKHGYTSESGLITAFKKWLMNKPYIELVANAAYKEAKALCLRIRDTGLSRWSDRQFETPHIIALKFKQLMLPIKDNYCCSLNSHSFFQKAVISKNFETSRAKQRHGFHCALYDVYELYLGYILS